MWSLYGKDTEGSAFQEYFFVFLLFVRRHKGIANDNECFY